MEQSASTYQYRNIFMRDAVTLTNHIQYLRDDPVSYERELLDVVDKSITITSAVKARVYAALWHCKKIDLLDRLQALPGVFTVVEILKAVKLLDSGRQIRALQKKLARLELNGARSKTLGKVRAQINDTSVELSEGTGASGALARRIKRWTSQIPEERLEFFLMQYPAEPWQQLADICHLSPNDFKLNWFLKAIHGEEIEGSPLVQIIKNISPSAVDNIGLLLRSNPRLADYYSTIRIKIGSTPLPADAKREFVARAPLLEVIWWYHDLHSGDETEKILEARLQSGERLADSSRSNYCKLMERLLFFRERKYKFAPLFMPIVSNKLEDMDAPSTNMKSVVIGDASSSMQMAIRIASIIGSLLSVYLHADLNFFTTVNIKPPVVPRTAEDVVLVSETVKAHGATAPAASLYPYYERKEKVDLFVIVTDEEENRSFQGFRFAQLFKKYLETVHESAKVMLVSLISNNTVGQMRGDLEAIGITPLQFVFDKARPDLSKFDSVLGILSNEILHFAEEERVSNLLRQVQDDMAKKLAADSSKSSGPATVTDSLTEVAMSEMGDDMSMVSYSEVASRCLTCTVNAKDTVLLDCKHQCLCLSCSKKTKTCPLCNAPVRDVLQVNL
eukprot:GILJ01002135.1.p1 GENE.GILJ01002135.1~~GILJ01002135.1.p1  ORF type:complete len:641 (-),score=94.64 GILJ01002135.1:147-2000(-)